MAHDLSKDQVATLLSRLSTDAAFHTQFSKDPTGALKSIGFPTALGACMATRQLASMKAISDASAGISSLFNDAKTMAQNVHDLAAK